MRELADGSFGSEAEMLARTRPASHFGHMRSRWWQSPVNFSDYSFDLGAKNRPMVVLCAEEVTAVQTGNGPRELRQISPASRSPNKLGDR